MSSQGFAACETSRASQYLYNEATVIDHEGAEHSLCFYTPQYRRKYPFGSLVSFHSCLPIDLFG